MATTARTAYSLNRQALRAIATRNPSPDLPMAALVHPARLAAVSSLRNRTDPLAARRPGRIMAAAELRALGDAGLADVFPVDPASAVARADHELSRASS